MALLFMHRGSRACSGPPNLSNPAAKKDAGLGQHNTCRDANAALLPSHKIASPTQQGKILKLLSALEAVPPKADAQWSPRIHALRGIYRNFHQVEQT